MPTTTLGRTGLTVNKNGFGALPVQRTAQPAAGRVLQAARDAGIDFFDTARAYSDSEEKLGAAFGGAWQGLTLATKTAATTTEAFWRDLETSLKLLRKDTIDIYQFHNPASMPTPGDGTGLYEAMCEAREKGLIRFIGITSHRLPVANAAVDSGLYDTLQFPFSYLAGEQDLALVAKCREKNVGFIAMKALAGGMLTDISAAVAWMDQYDNVVPIWGIQSAAEMAALAGAMGQPAGLTAAHKARIEADRTELTGSFCRGCGYCLPCPADIEINMAARFIRFAGRAPIDPFEEKWQSMMAKVDGCIACGACATRCPYQLDPQALVKQNRAAYLEMLETGPGA